MEGYEGGIDIRRDDGTLDASINVRGRNREVHLQLTVDGATYAYATLGVDLTPELAHELIGALKDAVHASGPAEVTFPRPASVSPAADGRQWVEREPGKWTARQVGHVLGERD